jgi:hypothetical protein
MSENSGFTILKNENKGSSLLVLKGKQQNDEKYIEKSKKLFGL